MLNSIKNLFHKNSPAIIVQARVGSSRYPRKVFSDLNGRACIDRVVDRVKMSKRVRKVILAIPNTKADDELAAVLGHRAIIFRGSESDVLQRVVHAARHNGVDAIVDITADCPLVDPALIDEMYRIFKKGGWDYVSNTVRRCFPDGFDVQIYRTEVLEQIERILEPSHRSRAHTGWNIVNHRSAIERHLGRRLRILHIAPEDRYDKPDWRVTLDTKEDAILLSAIFEYFDNRNEPGFSYGEVCDFLLDCPALLEINSKIKPKTPGEG